jgi:single-strand DNA-binding protein
MNKIILIGRLTKDVDMRFTQEGKAVANFTLAVDRPYKNQQGEKEADFIKIVAWGKLAEHCGNYIGKGRLVAVCGRLQTRSYKGDDGQRRYVTEVVADEVKFLDWPKEEPLVEFEGPEYEGEPF